VQIFELFGHVFGDLASLIVRHGLDGDLGAGGVEADVGVGRAHAPLLAGAVRVDDG
jgi:hypothetical protein